MPAVGCRREEHRDCRHQRRLVGSGPALGYRDRGTRADPRPHRGRPSADAPLGLDRIAGADRLGWRRGVLRDHGLRLGRGTAGLGACPAGSFGSGGAGGADLGKAVGKAGGVDGGCHPRIAPRARACRIPRQPLDRRRALHRPGGRCRSEAARTDDRRGRCGGRRCRASAALPPPTARGHGAGRGDGGREHCGASVSSPGRGRPLDAADAPSRRHPLAAANGPRRRRLFRRSPQGGSWHRCRSPRQG